MLNVGHHTDRTSPQGQGSFFPPQATSPSAVGCSQPPSVGGPPPSAVVPVPFQLRPWWTPLYGTSSFLAFEDVLPEHPAGTLTPCPMGISSTMGGHGCRWAEREWMQGGGRGRGNQPKKRQKAALEFRT